MGDADVVTKGDCVEHREAINKELSRIEQQSIARWEAAKEAAKDQEDRSIHRWEDACEQMEKTDKATQAWLLRVEQKFDRLLWWMMVTEASVIVTFAFVLLGRLFDVHII